MEKIIQIATSVSDQDFVLYALTEDGKVYIRKSENQIVDNGTGGRRSVRKATWEEVKEVDKDADFKD